MNVKPGDLAVVVMGVPERNIGKILRVQRLCAWATVQQGTPVWDCDDPDCVYADAALRPIRDQDGEDETLTWAGKPSDIKEPNHA